MADGDEKPAETNPDGSPKKDLRYTSHEDRNVRVDRELDGSGHLARGDVTKMSVLNFSSRHQARTERDPDFTFRPAPAKPASPAEPPVTTDQASPAGPPSAAEPALPLPGAPEPPTLVDKIKNILGL